MGEGLTGLVFALTLGGAVVSAASGMERSREDVALALEVTGGGGAAGAIIEPKSGLRERMRFSLHGNFERTEMDYPLLPGAGLPRASAVTATWALIELGGENAATLSLEGGARTLPETIEHAPAPGDAALAFSIRADRAWNQGHLNAAFGYTLYERTGQNRRSEDEWFYGMGLRRVVNDSLQLLAEALGETPVIGGLTSTIVRLNSGMEWQAAEQWTFGVQAGVRTAGTEFRARARLERSF